MNLASKSVKLQFPRIVFRSFRSMISPSFIYLYYVDHVTPHLHPPPASSIQFLPNKAFFRLLRRSLSFPKCRTYLSRRNFIIPWRFIWDRKRRIWLEEENGFSKQNKRGWNWIELGNSWYFSVRKASFEFVKDRSFSIFTYSKRIMRRRGG